MNYKFHRSKISKGDERENLCIGGKEKQLSEGKVRYYSLTSWYLPYRISLKHYTGTFEGSHEVVRRRRQRCSRSTCSLLKFYSRDDFIVDARTPEEKQARRRETRDLDWSSIRCADTRFFHGILSRIDGKQRSSLAAVAIASVLDILERWKLHASHSGRRLKSSP